MNKKIKSALFLSMAGELKKLSYAVGAIMVANQVFGWFDSGKAAIWLSCLWFIALQALALFLVYKASEAAEEKGADSG